MRKFFNFRKCFALEGVIMKMFASNSIDHNYNFFWKKLSIDYLGLSRKIINIKY